MLTSIACILLGIKLLLLLGQTGLDEIKSNARLYKVQLEVGKDVVNYLQEYYDIPEQSLSDTHKRLLNSISKVGFNTPTDMKMWHWDKLFHNKYICIYILIIATQ